MENKYIRPFCGFSWLVFLSTLSCTMGLLSCQPEPVPLFAEQPTTIPPTLVSVQAVAADQAEVIVKAGFRYTPTDWRLTWLDANGRTLPINLDQGQRLTLFNLAPYRVVGLTAGQTYRLRFATRNAGGDSINVERVYVHPTDEPRWVRLAHAPLDRGDFAGSALSTDNLPPQESSRFLSVWRYRSDNSWQTLYYNTQNDSWMPANTYAPSLRHGIIRYQLQAVEGVTYSFNGLGFVTNEQQPGQRFYVKDMIVGTSNVVPEYAGPDGEVRFFTTADRAYQLTEGGASQVWVRQGTWGQYRTADLPEPTGTLATFRIGKTGYVVNQRPGQPIRLWAFDIRREQWSRRADFPGPARSQGIGFATDGKGYFGLGIDVNENGRRDLWQYDPAVDRWQYVTDYPGQGSTYVLVGQVPGHTFLGWGYDHQPTATGGIRLVGCSDFWEFKP